MKKYTFSTGEVVTTKLDKDEMLKRMDRLDWLRVLTECYDEGLGLSIFEKATRAYYKFDNFTGIIRLTFLEKDFLGYMLEGMLTDEEKEVIKFYTRY